MHHTCKGCHSHSESSFILTKHLLTVMRHFLDLTLNQWLFHTFELNFVKWARFKPQNYNFYQMYCGCMTTTSLDGFLLNTRANNCWWMDPLCCAFQSDKGIKSRNKNWLTPPPSQYKWKGIFLFCFNAFYVAEITAKHMFAPGCYRWSGYRLMWIVFSH